MEGSRPAAAHPQGYEGVVVVLRQLYNGRELELLQDRLAKQYAMGLPPTSVPAEVSSFRMEPTNSGRHPLPQEQDGPPAWSKVGEIQRPRQAPITGKLSVRTKDYDFSTGPGRRRS